MGKSRTCYKRLANRTNEKSLVGLHDAERQGRRIQISKRELAEWGVCAQETDVTLWDAV